MSRIGTYAEVLKRQFSSPKTTEENLEYTTYVKQPPQTSLRGNEGSSYTSNEGNVQTSTTVSKSKPQLADPPNNAVHMIRGATAKKTTQIDMPKSTKHSSIGIDTTTNVRQQTEINKGQRQDTITKRQVEQILTDKLAEITKTNQCNIQEIQDRMEAKIERIIESRLRTATNLMADAVTNRIMASLQRRLPLPPYKKDTYETDEGQVDTNITSPTETKPVQEKVIKVTPLSVRKTSNINSTADMLNAINQIENQTILHNDSPHDTTFTESFPAPS